jgi:gluconolactonase
MGLYQPPKDLITSVFSQLPDAYRYPDIQSAWIDANKPGQKIHSFLEGPSFDTEGNLYITDIPYGRIFRVNPAGNWQLIVQYDGWPNGLKIHQDGRIFIADYKYGIMLLNPEIGEITPFLTHNKSESFKGVNDLFFAKNGDLYFTDQGQSGMHDPSGKVYRYEFASQRLSCLIDNAPSPNGLVMSPDQKTLYVAMTRGNAVWRLPILADGTTSKVGIFTAMAGGVSGADGMAVDSEGNLFVCDAGNACVWVFSKHAEPKYRINNCLEGRTVTNLAFGGKDNKSLFITDSSTGSILTIEMDIPGQPMFSHQAL